ncbi:MAG: transglutaminase family protein [Polyangiaceae bacterium]
MRYLEATTILDFHSPAIVALVASRGWSALPERARIGAVYSFVRDEIAFGYNRTDDLRASEVLADGYGQCNTKTNLLMALLRAVGVACRFHGATVAKQLQRGVVPTWAYPIAPASILHGYAEVLFEGRFVALEGVILDSDYLDGLRARFPEERGAYIGFGAGTESLVAPANRWNGGDTYVQKTGVDADFGVFDSPDAFYASKGVNLSGVRAWLYQRWTRHAMNRRVSAIRGARSLCDAGVATSLEPPK